MRVLRAAVHGPDPQRDRSRKKHKSHKRDKHKKPRTGAEEAARAAAMFAKQKREAAKKQVEPTGPAAPEASADDVALALQAEMNKLKERRERVEKFKAEQAAKKAEQAAEAAGADADDEGAGAGAAGEAADGMEQDGAAGAADDAAAGGGEGASAEAADGWGSDEEAVKDSQQAKRRRLERFKAAMATTALAAEPAVEAAAEAAADDKAEAGDGAGAGDAEEEEEEQGKDGDMEEVDPLDAFDTALKKTIVKQRKEDRVKKAAAAESKDEGKSTMGELIFANEDGMYSEESDEEGLVNGKVVKVQGEEDSGNWSRYQPKARRELGVCDHDEIEYGEFRKAFYVEVPEITKMADHEVAEFRNDNEGIRVRGRNCPRPIKTWTQCGVRREILAICRKQGYDKPTPIQCQAIPVMMSGRDMMGIAKTGSGKTLAFLMPTFRHVVDQPTTENGQGPIALLLTPTRELALQTYTEANRFAKAVGRRVVVVYGGTAVALQIAELKRGADIVVCTPGRMIDMMASNSGKVTNVRRTTLVILDEADRMFDLGFEPQVMRILDNVRPDRQTIMFSATFPRQMEAIARRLLKKPIEVQIGGRSVVSDTIEQHAVVIDDAQKFRKLLELLGRYQQVGSVLVFVNSQHAADLILKDCMSVGYACLSLHGGIDQQDRDSNIKDFKAGNIRLLIATSVAARGLDVKTLCLVVNYDCPNHYEDYVHRVGRTGRAGRQGTAWTFITPDQASHAGDVMKAFELQGTDPPEDVKALWEKHKAAKKKAGKPLMLGGGSGFGGSGFKFNAEEADATASKRAKQAKKLGYAKDGDEEDEDDLYNNDDALEEELDDKVARLMGKKGDKTEEAEEAKAEAGPLMLGNGQPTKLLSPPPLLGATPAAANAARNSAALLPAKPEVKLSETASAGAKSAAEKAMEILKKKGLGPKPAGAKATPGAQAAAGHAAANPMNTINDVMAGKGVAATSKAAMAAAIALRINQKKGFKPQAAPVPTAAQVQKVEEEKEGRFEKEIEINDFPQEARFKMTRKEHIADISDMSNCAITCRGNFIAKGQKVKQGERKLFLFIEGSRQKDMARAEELIEVILREELHRQTTTFAGSGLFKQNRSNVAALTQGHQRGPRMALGWGNR